MINDHVDVFFGLATLRNGALMGSRESDPVGIHDWLITPPEDRMIHLVQSAVPAQNATLKSDGSLPPGVLCLPHQGANSLSQSAVYI